ncbi:MAG: DUF2179 domain-containing protein [Bacteroidota bacterium]|jgi:uncharacterized protein YebE (UPF0316 family)
MSDFDYYNWIVMPLLIFVARMSDVTLATLRNIFISKGFKHIVPFIGFFEVLIWLLAARQVFGSLSNPACFIAWAAGFSTGTYIGMRIDEYLALGMQVVRIITDQSYDGLMAAFRESEHGITLVNAEGSKGPVKLIFTVVKRKNIPDVIRIINETCPGAFYSIEDVRSHSHGVFVRESKLSLVKKIFPESKSK